MSELLDKLDELIKAKTKYQEGLDRAIEYTKQHGGTVEIPVRWLNTAELTLDGITCTVFQPYDDIDMFYYEA